jgi:hypothetical protein
MIHILSQGRALCGLEGTPSSWPEGHLWVSISLYREATCQSCQGTLRNLHMDELTQLSQDMGLYGPEEKKDDADP